MTERTFMVYGAKCEGCGVRLVGKNPPRMRKGLSGQPLVTSPAPEDVMSYPQPYKESRLRKPTYCRLCGGRILYDLNPPVEVTR